MLAAGGARTADEGGIGRADIQPAGDVQQLFAEIMLQPLPAFVGAPQQGHVEGAFGIGEADDARFAMGGAVGVRDVELLQPEDANAALGERIAGGAAHAANAEDDDIVMVFGHGALRCLATRTILAEGRGGCYAPSGRV